MSSSLIDTLEKLGSSIELEGIFNIHSNAGMVATSVFECCSVCDVATQLTLKSGKEDCNCGRESNNFTWFAVNSATTGAVLSIRSSVTEENIGLLIITDSDAAKKLVSHEVVIRENIEEDPDFNPEELDTTPDLAFLNDYFGAGLYVDRMIVTEYSAIVSDKIAHFNSDFAFLTVPLTNGEYLGVNYCSDQFIDSVENEDGEEVDTDLRPYAVLLIHSDYVDAFGQQRMFEGEAVTDFYTFFQVARDFDEMLSYYNYELSDAATRTAEGIEAPEVWESTACLKLNALLQMAKNNDGDAVSWMVQGMNEDDDLNAWLKGYLPIPPFVLESVMPARGYRTPTEFNLFLPPTLEQVVEGNPTFELFATAAQGVLDWVKENGEHWHVELRLDEDKVSRLWCHDNSNQSWKEIWAGWEPHQKEFQLHVSEETWRSLNSK
jgi:hypothetical protein